MACSRCAAHARLLRVAARPALPARPTLLAQPARFAPIAARFQARAQSTKPVPEGQSTKAVPEGQGSEIRPPPGLEGEYPDIDEVVKNAPKAPSAGMQGTYAIFKGTDRVYQKVAEPAAYSISIVDRQNGAVEQLPDGEELGVSQGPWHKRMLPQPTSNFNLPLPRLPSPLPARPPGRANTADPHQSSTSPPPSAPGPK